MKKLLVSLLIVAFVGVAVIAEDAPANVLKLSGRVQTGVVVNGGGNDGITAVLKDSKDTGNTLDSTLNVAYGDAAGTWGLNFGFEATADSVASLAVADTNAWVKPISQIRFMVGKSSLGDYKTLANGDGWVDNSVTNARLDIYPIDGLSFGILMPFDVTQKYFVDSVGSTAIGAKFVMDKVFGITAQYFFGATNKADSTKNDTDQFYLTSGAVRKNEGGNLGEFTASAVLYAVENLSAGAEVDLKLPIGKTIIGEQVAYDFGVVKPGVYVTETLQTTKIAGSDVVASAIYLNPGVDIRIIPNVFNPYIGAGLTFDSVKIGTADAKTGMQWKGTVRNDFAVGPGALRIGVDFGQGDATWGGVANGAVGNVTNVTGASSTALGVTDFGWDLQVSYNLTWNN